METKIKIRFLKEDNKKKFFRFLNKNWKKNYILTKNQNLFKWQFLKKKTYNFIIAYKDKEIIGCLGFINDNHFSNKINNNKDRYWLVNWLVDKDHSFNGLRLLDFLIEKKKPNFIGTIGCNKIAKEIYKKLNFEVGYMTCRYISFYPKKHYIMNHNLKEKKPIHSFKKDFFNEINLGNLKNIKFSDREFIKNRYLNHPVFKYKIYEVNKKIKKDNFIILREVTNKKKKSLAAKVIDFKLNDPNIAKKILLELCSKFNYEYISFYYYFTSNNKKKFNNLKLQNDNVIIPHYFSPFKKKNIRINFAYKFLKNKFETNFTLGDCDQDRPN